MGNARHTRAAGGGHTNWPPVRRNVAPGGRRRRADSGNACSLLGARESAWGQRPVGGKRCAMVSTTNVPDSSQWPRGEKQLRSQEAKGSKVSFASRLAEEAGESWSWAAASLKPSVRVTISDALFRAGTGRGRWQRDVGDGVVVAVVVVMAVLRETRARSVRRASRGQADGRRQREAEAVERATIGRCRLCPVGQSCLACKVGACATVRVSGLELVHAVGRGGSVGGEQGREWWSLVTGEQRRREPGTGRRGLTAATLLLLPLLLRARDSHTLSRVTAPIAGDEGGSPRAPSIPRSAALRG